jgi:hypothetical protein
MNWLRLGFVALPPPTQRAHARQENRLKLAPFFLLPGIRCCPARRPGWQTSGAAGRPARRRTTVARAVKARVMNRRIGRVCARSGCGGRREGGGQNNCRRKHDLAEHCVISWSSWSQGSRSRPNGKNRDRAGLFLKTRQPAPYSRSRLYERRLKGRRHHRVEGNTVSYRLAWSRPSNLAE